MRYRRYRLVGPSGRQITDVVVFVSLGFWLGYVVLIGLLFPVAPPAIPPQLRLGVPLPFLGWACVALLIAYLVWCAAGQRTTRLRPPTARLAVVQVVLATLRTILTASVLAALLATAGVPTWRWWVCSCSPSASSHPSHFVIFVSGSLLRLNGLATST